MEKAERMRKNLEALYLQYRAGKTRLSEILQASQELDRLIAHQYSLNGKTNRVKFEKNKENSNQAVYTARINAGAAN